MERFTALVMTECYCNFDAFVESEETAPGLFRGVFRVYDGSVEFFSRDSCEKLTVLERKEAVKITLSVGPLCHENGFKDLGCSLSVIITFKLKEGGPSHQVNVSMSKEDVAKLVAHWAAASIKNF